MQRNDPKGERSKNILTLRSQGNDFWALSSKVIDILLVARPHLGELEKTHKGIESPSESF